MKLRSRCPCRGISLTASALAEIPNQEKNAEKQEKTESRLPFMVFLVLRERKGSGRSCRQFRRPQTRKKQGNRAGLVGKGGTMTCV